MRRVNSWVIAAAAAAIIAMGWSGAGRLGTDQQRPAPETPGLSRAVGGTAASLLAASALEPALAAAGPGTSYTTGTAQLLKAPGGAAVGTVTPGTPVTVTTTQGADAQVSITGYSSAGSNAVVTAVGERIILANVTQPDQAQRQLGAQTKDSYGTVWTQVTLSGWVATSALTSDVQTIWTHGRQVYEAHCSTCHSLYAPDQFTANQWPGNLQAMASNGGLAGEDLALVLKYLQTHAKPQ